jgi:DNA modification methylase
VVLDAFAGPGAWGKIVWERNRHWIGCDIVKGGMTKVLA